ncbi:N(G),N(G)-dimethylarginine dimethylaminohydrolase 1 isoform X1 [Selaginella moellendorffii]|uniref:N(G),N(G)-dimethylarginine dimethylaminohydrolase 1 isoform X1 n=1 Tax=Selaginella moellendorffii TaxID=88036 RepID=UPI000D1CA54A|nr:N(G),N(G)-dimethylarginine dimethylaminohydrolase 1 isoform X1 [Selaginella moellendorffii]|eukprot:XP_024527694.1 N(G),N(G)-dimethylarginine dimethylaminohydrolase 1 isoform X1 [Selaginella moellendorffii]
MVSKISAIALIDSCSIHSRSIGSQEIFRKDSIFPQIHTFRVLEEIFRVLGEAMARALDVCPARCVASAAGAVPTNSSKPRLALVRGVPHTFSSCITMEKSEAAIDVELARKQHSDYVNILRELVDHVVELSPMDEFPDCPFIEDTAVVIGSKALITRPGASLRRGEVEAVEAELRNLGFEIHNVEPPGTIDGGDVLYVQNTLFVGKSMRTNSRGIEALARAFSPIPVVPIDVAETLHLKSVLSPLGRNSFLAEETFHAKQMLELIRKASMDSCDCVFTPHQGAANLLWVGNTLVYPSAYPCGSDLAELYANSAERVIPANISEFHKGDGGLTCLSIVID